MVLICGREVTHLTLALSHIIPHNLSLGFFLALLFIISFQSVSLFEMPFIFCCLFFFFPAHSYIFVFVLFWIFFLAFSIALWPWLWMCFGFCLPCCSLAALPRSLLHSPLSWMTLRSGSVPTWWDFFIFSFFTWAIALVRITFNALLSYWYFS